MPTAYEYLTAPGALHRGLAGTRPARREEFDVLLAQHRANVRAARQRLAHLPVSGVLTYAAGAFQLVSGPFEVHELLEARKLDRDRDLDTPLTWFVSHFEGVGTVLVFLVSEDA